MVKAWLKAAALLAMAVLAPACGGGGGGSGGGVHVPIAVVGTPVGTVSGNVTISYTLSDVEGGACTIVAEFSTNGGVSYAAATKAAGGEGLTGLACTAAGSPHSFVWNSLADGVATLAANAAVRFRITPTNTDAGTPGETQNFTVDNSSNSAPSVAVTTPGGTQTGNITISYALTDAESHACTILVEFSANGGATFAPATAAPGGDGVVGLAASPGGGTAHAYVWDSLADNVATGGVNAAIRIRITATDSATGAPGSTGDFTVDNTGNTAPTVTITPPNSPSSGMVAIDYSLVDGQSHTCSVVVEASIDGGTNFFVPTRAPAGDLLTGLTSSPGGTAHQFVWASFADGVGTAAANTTVQVRITATDAISGAASTTANFTVDNTAVFSGADIGGGPLNLNPGYSATSVVLDGRFVYVGGHDFSQWRIEKIDPTTGVSVWSKTSDPTGGDDRLIKMATDGTYLYIVGRQEVAPFGGSAELQWRIEKRLLSTGELVPSFGDAGAVVSANFGDSPAVTFAIDATSMIVTGVIEAPPLSGTIAFRTEKRSLGDGSLVGTFGTGGVLSDAGGLSVAIDATHFYLVGTENFPTDSRVRLEKRKLTDGSLEATFGTGGAIVTDNQAGAGWEMATQIAIDATYMYVFESIETGAGTGIFPWKITKRDLATGTGTVLSVTGAGSTGFGPVGSSMVVDGSSLYVSGKDDASPGDGRWRFEKRKTSDLTLDTTFNATGVVSFNPTVSVDEEYANCIAVMGGLLVVVGDDNGGTRQWRVEGRYK